MKKESVRASKNFNKKLAAYSATAGAALLATPAAHAVIQDISSISPTNTLSFLNTSGSLAFTAGPFHGTLHGSNHFSMHMLPFPPYTPVFSSHGTAKLAGDVKGLGNASRVAKSAAFSGGFANGVHSLANFHFQSGYLAFKTGSYYGWLKVKINNGAFAAAPDQISLVANSNGIFGAFDKISSTSSDGFTVGSLAPVPEPSVTEIGGLGLLAFGAAGIRELRKRRSAAASKV